MINRCIFSAVIAITLAASAGAVTIEVEFLGNTFYSQDAQARAAIEAAAAHVGDALTSTLTSIDEDQFVGQAGDTTATLDWTFEFRDAITQEPIGNFPTVVPNPSLAADTVKVFVDAQPLPGNPIGIGVPSGAGADIGVSFIPPLNGAAIQQAAGLADGETDRGGDGPLIGVLFEGQDNLGGVDVNPIRFRSSFGGIALDTDPDDNGIADTTQQLLDFWHLDHTSAVDPAKIDLFSVAVSEIATALGFGSSDSFEDQVNELDWLGAEVADLLGNGEDLLDPLEPGHVREGTLSTRVSDGAVQQAALDPVISQGERTELTALDLALLRDIGWQTIDAAAQPGDYNGDGTVDGIDYAVWREALGDSPGTLPNDIDGGVIGANQFATWQANFGAGAAATAIPTPEPAAIGLLSLAGAVGWRRRVR